MSRSTSDGNRVLDVVCLGRAAVDLYGLQTGGRLEDMQSFAKYLGGSSANLAAGLARLGVKSAMLTRVGDEQMGRFVREALAREGVDVSRVVTDPSRLTGMVVLGIGGAGDTPHIFFRERCADMGLCPDDVDEDFIASAQLLAVTGTHLSSETTRAAVAKAIAAAHAAGTRVVLDIDYRPVLWGLGRAGDGASRYVESGEISDVIRAFLPRCDLIIGTEEEIAIAGGSTNPLDALQAIRRESGATIVMKRGALGSSVFEGDIDSLDDGVTVGAPEVDVLNTVGAGDAFLSGFLSGWLSGEAPERCALLGNACGALVVSRHGCTPAMPGKLELETFLERRPPPRQPEQDAELAHLHRATTWADDPRSLCVLAFDHRSQFEDLARRHGQPLDAIGRFKNLIAEVLLEVVAGGEASVRYGAIIDHRHGDYALARLAGADIWAGSPIEVPGSRPLEFDPAFATGLHIAGWPQRQVVKCLLFYHPDDPPELRHEQEQRVRALYADVVAMGRRLLLEIICPATEHAVTPSTLPRTLRRFYNLGVRPDWWKLQAQADEGWEGISRVIAERDPHCKGVVLLGLGADEQTLAGGIAVAARYPICRGFAVGRSIFADASEQWFAGSIDSDQAKALVNRRYLNMIETWCKARRTMEDGALHNGG
jgi:5-dehydro-2-deoxygluconokinase